jgi:hypothetical protein
MKSKTGVKTSNHYNILFNNLDDNPNSNFSSNNRTPIKLESDKTPVAFTGKHSNKHVNATSQAAATTNPSSKHK